jgi:hypothetical protein
MNKIASSSNLCLKQPPCKSEQKGKKAAKAVFASVLALSLAAPVPAFAYELTGQYMDSSLWYTASSVFYSETRENMRLAMASWNNYLPEYRRLCFNASTTHSSTGFPSKDGNNYIYKEYLNDSLALGVNRTWSKGNGVITESDIDINASYSWSNAVVSNAYHVPTVSLHELGHSLGIANNSDSSTIMCGIIPKGTVRTISSDDTDAIYAIYGTISPNAVLATNVAGSDFSLSSFASDNDSEIFLAPTTYYFNNATNSFSATSDGKLSKEQMEREGVVEYDTVEQVDVTTVDLSQDVLADASELVVTGEFVSKSEPFAVQGADGSTVTNFSDYTFKISDTYYGEAVSGYEGTDGAQYITVRVRGGALGGLLTWSDLTDKVSVGQQCMLYLTRYYTGADFNTGTDIYYIVGESGGVWDATDDGYANEVVADAVTTDELGQYFANYSENNSFTDRVSEKESAFNNWLEAKEASYISGDISAEEISSINAQTDLYLNNFASKLDGVTASGRA